MKNHDLLDQRLNQVFEPHEPDPTLKTRLKMKVNVQVARPNWVTYGLSGLALTGLAAAVVIGLVLTPRTTLAQAVLKRVDAFEGHLSMYNISPEGQRVLVGEEWIQGAKDFCRRTQPTTYELLRDSDLGFSISWQPNIGSLRFSGSGSYPSNLVPSKVTTETIKRFLGNTSTSKFDSRIERTSFNGRSADCLTVVLRPSIAVKFFAEPESHNLLGWRYQCLTPQPAVVPIIQPASEFVVDGKPFPAGIFKPVFPLNGLKTDVVQDRNRWIDRLSKPLAVFPVNLVPRQLPTTETEPPAKESVTIRNVSVNDSGDVFVLYTSFKAPYGCRVIPVAVSDSVGGKYAKGFGFIPSGDPGGIQIDKEPLEGAWFVHVAGPSNRGNVSIGFKQECEPMSKIAFQYHATTASFLGEIPSYMPYMTMPISTRTDWLKDRTDVLSSVFEAAKDFRREETCLRQIIALDETSDIHESHFVDAELYYGLARSLENQGKKREALATYRKAQVLYKRNKQFNSENRLNEIADAIRRLTQPKAK